MKIAMILDAPFPPDPRVENEAVSLIKGGHDVFLFCLKYHNELADEVINKIQVHRYKSNKLEYKLSALANDFPFYSFLMKRKLDNFISKIKPDAIHIHDIKIANAVFQVNKNYKLPIVLDLHDNLPEVMKLYPHLQKFPGKFIISPERWKRKEVCFIKKATKIVTVSPHFVSSLRERVPSQKENIVLVPNTIRSSFYEKFEVDNAILERYKNNFVLLYLGDTHLRRGLQTAIKSLTNLSQAIPNIKLVIVGKNTTDPILKQQVSDLKLNKFVDFEGWQNANRFQTYITASDICISPLHRNLQHDVAYANKIFQYMSFGKPILVSNAIAQKELVEKYNSGLVHKEKDYQDFANKVLKLFKNNSLAKTLGNNGKNFVRSQFTWEQTSKELLKLYENLKD